MAVEPDTAVLGHHTNAAQRRMSAVHVQIYSQRFLVVGMRRSVPKALNLSGHRHWHEVFY